MKQEVNDMSQKANNCYDCFRSIIICISIVLTFAFILCILCFKINIIAFVAIAIAITLLGCCAIICVTVVKLKCIELSKKQKNCDLDCKILEKALKVNIPMIQTGKTESKVNHDISIRFGKSK